MPTIPDSGPVIEILHEPASGVVTSARDERTEPRAKHPDEIPITAFWSADKHNDQSGAVRTAAAPISGPVKLPSTGRDDTLDKWAHDDSSIRMRTDRAQSDTDVEPAPSSRLRLVLLIVLLLAAGGLYLYQYLVKNGLIAATSAQFAPLGPTASAPPVPAPSAPPVPAASAPPASAASAPPVPAASAPLAAAASALPAPAASAPPMPAASAAAAPAALVQRPRPPSELPALDVTAAVEQARATLRADLAATSPRLQRLAAAALARTQDPAARDALAAHIGVAAVRESGVGEINEIAKLDLAYSLARGGDPRGGTALAAALGSQRGDVRDEAARLLALLGDHRGVPHLTDLLAVSQRRLGAAEHLAHLAEPHAIKVLEQICGDARASADDKARATIALGIAGHAEVARALRDMLVDPHFNAFAAAALAELKDRAAQPVLEHQLDSPSLRVRAARALRRLDPALDPAPVLPHLLDVLVTGRDTDQVQAAEAILVLAGPTSWSAYE